MKLKENINTRTRVRPIRLPGFGLSTQNWLFLGGVGGWGGWGGDNNVRV